MITVTTFNEGTYHLTDKEFCDFFIDCFENDRRNVIEKITHNGITESHQCGELESNIFLSAALRVCGLGIEYEEVNWSRDGF